MEQSKVFAVETKGVVTIFLPAVDADDAMKKAKAYVEVFYAVQWKAAGQPASTCRTASDAEASAFQTVSSGWNGGNGFAGICVEPDDPPDFGRG